MEKLALFEKDRREAVGRDMHLVYRLAS